MASIAIFGAAGAVGRNTGMELARRGVPFVAVGRTGAKLREAFAVLPNVEVREADVTSPEAAAGIETILYAVGVPYTAFEQHPVLMRGALDAAARAGVRRMIVVSSVYSYGIPSAARVSEDHARNPVAFKGRKRKEQEDIALQETRLRTLVLRLPDFYGPHAENSLAHMIFRAALENKAANWLGSPDLPHEFVYVPDVAKLVAELVQREDLDGAAWNYGGPGSVTGREFMTAIYREAGATPKWRTAGRTMLRVAGLFNPMMRELVEMQYLHETPVVLDDSRLMSRLGHPPKTPYETGIRDTVAFLRRCGA